HGQDPDPRPVARAESVARLRGGLPDRSKLRPAPREWLDGRARGAPRQRSPEPRREPGDRGDPGDDADGARESRHRGTGAIARAGEPEPGPAENSARPRPTTGPLQPGAVRRGVPRDVLGARSRGRLAAAAPAPPRARHPDAVF